jgi:hypothetical protein
LSKPKTSKNSFEERKGKGDAVVIIPGALEDTRGGGWVAPGLKVYCTGMTGVFEDA